jgi:endonuclease/exonuclease/phosphatase family metal-dependent hydrolase
MFKSDTKTLNLSHLLIVSLTVVMTFQVIRVFVTSLVYAFGERYGQTLAAVPALVVFLSPFFIPLIMTNLRRSLFFTFGGLAVVRLLMQVSRDVNINLVLSGVAIILALSGLVLALSWLSSAAAHRRQFALGIFVGMILESALHGAFLTWDYVWQPGIVPLIAALIVSLLALFALWRVRSDFPDQPPQLPVLRDLLPIAGLGPLFMLELLFLQNPGFAASSSLTSMEIALAVILIGDALGIWVLSQSSRIGLPIRLIAGVALVVIAVLLPQISGAVVLLLIVIGQAAAGALLPSILSGLSKPTPRSGILRMSVAVGSGSLLFALLVILYYISGLITLPFSYTLLPPVAAVILFLAAFAPPIQDAITDWRFAILPLLLLLIPLSLFITRPAIPSTPADPERFRLVNYNIHQTISFYGWLDPEAVALVIEAQNPDVVALQEVSRGWLIAGSLDVAEWLSRRLQMPYVYAPGHDYQFGNIIFTRLPITDWSFTELPLQDVPLRRGLIRADIDLGDGITVINTHLSAYATTEARIPQVQKVLEAWNGAPRTLIVGDMNGHPEDADIALFLGAGLTSAQDATGNPDLLTFSSAEPVERIDWIFGTSEFQFSDFVIPSTTASDHLPLAVTVQ